MTDDIVYERNNMGVAHLTNGDMNSALAYLRAAFNDAKKCCLMHQAATAHSSMASNSPDRTSSKKRPLESPHLRRTQMIDALRPALSADTRQHGLRITPTSFEVSSSGSLLTPLQSSNVAAATVVFNLGLVYSILGSRDLEERTLIKSKTLLDSCRRLLLSLFDSIPGTETLLPTENPLVDHLWIMTLTKLAESSCMLSDYGHAENYNARLNEFFSLVQLNPEYMQDPEVKHLLLGGHQNQMAPNFRNKMFPSLAPAA